MADKPANLQGEETEAERKQVSHVRKLLSLAETDLNRHKARISTCYKFGLPWRHGFDQSQPTDQLDEVFTSEVMTVLEDFAADMLNTFTPMKAQWCDFKPVEQLAGGDAAMLKNALEKYGQVLFAEMRRSNLYQALQEGYLDLGPGTMALCIKDRNAAEPIHCEAIPAPDLLLNRGAYGRIDGIWRKWLRMHGQDIGLNWPDAKRPKAGAWDAGDMTEYDVIDGVYRDWTTPAQEAWHYVVLVGGRLVYSERYVGRGSNPLITARWSRDSTTAWGVGPTYRVTPSIKVLNYLTEKVLKAIDKHVDPATSYEDDGVMNLEHGVSGGDWIPRAVGSKAPEVIESKTKLDIAFLEAGELIHEIRRAHYQDRPEQEGKTPPSATQWADEAAERARRMGTPATNLVHELQYGIIHRFAHLLNKRGVLPKVELNGREIALEPISPLLRAQEQEEVVRMDRFVEMMGRFGPQIASVVIKPAAYAVKLGEKMGIPADVIASEEEIKQALEMFGSILGKVGGQAGDVSQSAPGAVP